jgi:NitT/TauT family transport system ATP-binding protein
MLSLSDYIVIDGVQKAFDHSEPVISDISMTVSRGEFVSLFGPNGCGKTTFLKILVGMDNEFQGTVRIDGKLPEQASVGIVPQNSNDALLPWRRVLENIVLPLELGRLSRRERTKAVHEFIEGVGIELPLNMYPYQLSGGQKQVVVLIRALISKPELLVLDEPFISLDFRHMILAQEALLRLWQFTKTTTFLVTHDLLSAVYLSDRVFLLSPRPMRVVSSREIDLPRPRFRQDPKLVSLLGQLQRSFLTME